MPTGRAKSVAGKHRKIPASRSGGFRRPVIMGEFDIKLDGRNIKYTLKRSRAARLVWLKIKPENGLTVTIPSFYDSAELPQYLVSRSAWILRNLDKCLSPVLSPESNPSAVPEKIPFMGKYFSLKINQRTKEFTAIALDNESLDFSFCSILGETSRRGVKTWLKNQAEHIISEKVEHLSRKLSIFPEKVFVKDQHSLWGSCSARRNLNFNWRLIMVPEIVMEYVIIHELCHLKEMSHSRSFWKLVAEHCPDWRVHRKWLNEHCYELKAQLSGK